MNDLDKIRDDIAKLREEVALLTGALADLKEELAHGGCERHVHHHYHGPGVKPLAGKTSVWQ